MPKFKFHSLTNIEIDNFFKSRDALGATSYLGTVSSDFFETSKSRKLGYYIYNLETSTESGSHWCMVANLKDFIICFDSYGCPINESVLKWCRTLSTSNGAKDIYYQDAILQPVKGYGYNMCGYICIYVIMQLLARSYSDILYNDFKLDDPPYNVKVVANFFTKNPI